MRNFLVAGGLVLLAAGCRTHPQGEGTYTLTAREILRDECGLSSVGTVLGTGTFRVLGDQIRMPFSLAAVPLVGQFQEQTEAFVLDGTAGPVTLPVGSQSCFLDRVAVHLEGTTQSASTFEGTLKVEYQADRPESCVCQLWARFDARR